MSRDRGSTAWGSPQDGYAILQQKSLFHRYCSTQSLLAQSTTTEGNSTLDTAPQSPNAGGTVGSEGIARPDPGVTNSVTDSEACKTMSGTTAQRPKTPGSQAEPQPQARCQNK